MSKFDLTMLLCSAGLLGAFVVSYLGREETKQPEPQRMRPPAAVKTETRPPTPVAWHSSLAAALESYQETGKPLAIIIGTEGCAPCKQRLAEAKALTASRFDWVYCLNTDPACDIKLPAQPFPIFATLEGDKVTAGVPPTALGLKESIE